MNGFDDPVGQVLLFLLVSIAVAAVISLLCALTDLCVRIESRLERRKVIGAVVDWPAPECRTIEDDWRYDWEPRFVLGCDGAARDEE